MNKLSKLAELAAQLPDDLVASWRGTNHYELTSASRQFDYWWLNVNNEDDWSEHLESGQRMGLLLDIAAEVSRLKREGVL